jgi:heptosyltransferase-2
LGGREDKERNEILAGQLGVKVINTPTGEGLRRGLVYVNVCDIVITGDTLGMHMAIGLGKYVVGWFNVTCAQEIELYGRGEKIISESFCSPCWKKSCDDLRCLDEPFVESINKAVQSILKRHFPKAYI